MRAVEDSVVLIICVHGILLKLLKLAHVLIIRGHVVVLCIKMWL